MIGAFPALYPDELLVSGLARYEAWLGHPRRQALLEDLFGASNLGICFDLPARLGHLATALLPGHPSGNVDTLIDAHTVLPFYAAFLSQERVTSVRQAMDSDQPSNIHALLGLNTNRAPLAALLRYCPVCVMKDRHTWEECYWHRVHQLPGVHVCPHHATWLASSQVPMHLVRGRQTFTAAEQAVEPGPARPLHPEDGLGQRLLRLARNAW